MESKQYQREYYLRNKERLLSYRKQKYRTDIKYRTAIKNRAKMAIRLKSIFRPSYRMFDNEINEPLYLLEKVSTITGRSIATLKWLIHCKIIPAHTYKRFKFRAYSESQVRLLELVFKMADTLGLNYFTLHNILDKFWTQKFNEKEVIDYVKEIIDKKEIYK